MSQESFWRYFFEIYEDLPRQGPGDRQSTERALAMLPPLASGQRILDIGCGTGAQTLDLARATPAQITAVDNHPAFIDQLVRRVRELDLGERITTQVADMNDLPFPDGAFDVVWSEGAIFIMGFSKGLTAWRRLLKPGGHLVVSEFCWLKPDPPAELAAFCTDGCTDVGEVEDRRRAVAAAGYRLLGDFVLPERVWWESYHAPLAEVLARFRAKHASNPEALEVADRSQKELDLFREHPGYGGYAYFVLQRDGSAGG